MYYDKDAKKYVFLDNSDESEEDDVPPPPPAGKKAEEKKVEEKEPDGGLNALLAPRAFGALANRPG